MFRIDIHTGICASLSESWIYVTVSKLGDGDFVTIDVVAVPGSSLG